jgi:hypothetical protein
MKTFLTTTLLLLAAIPTGCRQSADPTSAPTGVDLATIRYDTGDLKEWPHYDFELHHSFHVPEVPPEIIGPFSPEDLPYEE